MTEWYYAGAMSAKVATGSTLELCLVLSAWLKPVHVEMTGVQNLGTFFEGVFPEEYAWKRVPEEDQGGSFAMPSKTCLTLYV